MFKSSPKHPPGESMKKNAFHKASSWCQKGWRPLVERTMIGKETEKADLSNNFSKYDCEGKDREIWDKALDLESVCLLHIFRMGAFEYLHG